MPIHEFDIIKKYFKAQATARKDIITGIGDDAAVVSVPPNHQLVISTDTLVSGIHFFSNTDPEDIAYKSLAVNLSDMAAMAATPAWVTLSLTLPEANEHWLQHFAESFFELAQAHHVALIGGDLSSGPLSVTIGIYGFVPTNTALKRSGAKPGDLIYVTGNLGAAAFAVQMLQQGFNVPLTPNILQRLYRPIARVKEGELLRAIASAAIDISDGLLADLNHILEASHCGAKIESSALPIHQELLSRVSLPEARKLALSGGDDYELCFTVSEDNIPALKNLANQLECPITKIGQITSEQGLQIYDEKDQVIQISHLGYQHF
ncbi:MAG: thiamine-phosphate kinase [Proteobacteria bacterium]|nr:thiamine-phosphate kinase [Pseudomonadota bacterium]